VIRAIAILALLPSLAAADCQRAIQVRLAPIPNLQIAVWLEDASHTVIDTIYVTRSTGALGLANRPGHPRFRGDYRFPYGRREMVLPVWAYARQKLYPLVEMGGAPGLDDDNTIGYHFPVSSPESFYCSPSGGIQRMGVDTISCASPFYGSKGAYVMGKMSHYPPRADLTSFTDHDSPDAHNFASDNDTAIVSGATPPGNAEISPSLLWMAPGGLPDGNYFVRVEASQEADFNAGWPKCDSSDPNCAHPTFLDEHTELQSYGHDLFGQPSLVWTVPITIDGTARVALADAIEGYGSWDGSSGALTPQDGTISTTVDGSGQRRLIAQNDADGTWRVKVNTSGCGNGLCVAPAAPTQLVLVPSDTSIAVTFDAPAGTVRPERYEVRYRAGGGLTNDNFSTATPGDLPPEPGGAGVPQTYTVSGLKPDTMIAIGIRAVAACGASSPIVFGSAVTTPAQFTTLHGCFVATAAYGSAMEGEVETLRAFRDRRMLTNPIGKLGVAVYYAFSPSLARAIARDERVRGWVREVLWPIVEEVRR
jgi:hypothetical protein